MNKEFPVLIKPTGNAHFSRLRIQHFGAGVIRIEYAPDGEFEDRPTVRMATRPAEGRAIDAEQLDDGCWQLSFKGGAVRYRPGDEAPNADNLQIMRPDGSVWWRPGQVDEQNYGGVHGSLDVVNGSIIARGVHPAGSGQ